MSALEIVLVGIPLATPRARATTRKGRGGTSYARVYNPTSYTRAKADIARQLKAAMAGRPLLDGPLMCQVEAWWECPKHLQRKRSPYRGGYKDTTPDDDNVAKAIRDAANGVVWVDDARVSIGWTGKFIAPQGGPALSIVTIAPLITVAGITELEHRLERYRFRAGRLGGW